MDNKQKEKTRSGYFSNVKSRLGTRLPSGFTQPSGFVTGPWDASVIANAGRVAVDPGRHHIRNPKLRQYYLKEAAFPSDTTTKTLQSAEVSSRKDEQAVPHKDTVFSIDSQLCDGSADVTLITQKISATPSDLPEPKLDAVTPTTPVSPSTDAEYDKLVDVESVPLPDGQLCLLALPPECTQGTESAGLSCLKLFCRFITDRKGVVSGILLVAANKIFFDPYKSLPLVQENGCEEYLFSCPVDHLASVTFFSDVSRVHFSRSTQRWKSRKKATGKKGKTSKDPVVHVSVPRSGTQATSTPASAVANDVQVETKASDAAEDEIRESKDIAEVERQLELLALELNTGQQLCSGKQLSGHGRTGSMMFVRMRQKPQLVKKKGFKTLELGKAKTAPCRDAWFILRQESSDQLYAYLSHHRPDLCILEGAGEVDEAEDEDDFVILSEGEDEEEEAGRDGRAGDEWEMVCVEDSRVKEPLSINKEPDGLKDIVKQSLILNTQHVRELSSELPPRTVGHSWRLTYSTSKHGASLKTLYRKLRASDSPVLLLIRDDNEQVFGGFLSHPLHLSDTFYGTGETFLFLLHPRFKCFRWTGENSFFIKGDLDAFAIGGGSGHFGLWLDESLYVGRSSPCYTFNNCSLSEKSDFRVLELEAWTFW